MHANLRRGLLGTLFAGGLLALGTTVASAADTSGADGTASGTQVVAPVTAPVTLGAISLGLAGDPEAAVGGAAVAEPSTAALAIDPPAIVAPVLVPGSAAAGSAAVGSEAAGSAAIGSGPAALRAESMIAGAATSTVQVSSATARVAALAPGLAATGVNGQWLDLAAAFLGAGVLLVTRRRMRTA
jgi:hypothetical protein